MGRPASSICVALAAVEEVGVSNDQWIILGPVLTAIIGLVAIALQSRSDRLRRERARLYEDRRKIYMQIIEPFVLSFSPGQGQKALKIMMSAEYRLAAREFSLIGSDDAVRALNDLMQHFYQHGDEPPDSRTVLKLLGGLFLEMRKEFMGRKTKLRSKDMFRAQITDIDSIID